MYQDFVVCGKKFSGKGEGIEVDIQKDLDSTNFKNFKEVLEKALRDSCFFNSSNVKFFELLKWSVDSIMSPKHFMEM